MPRTRRERHLVEKKPASEVCNKAGIQPSVFDKWERDLLEGPFASRRAPSREAELEQKVAALEAKRDAVP